LKNKINVLSLFDGISVGQQALKKNKVKIDNYYASEIDSYAINVTRKNFPKTKFVGDVTKVDVSELDSIDLLIGGSPCFIAGTKIKTEEDYKNIEDIIVGDKVLTHTGKYKKVLKIGGTVKKTFIINVLGIDDTETTENHPYYVREELDKNPIWKEVKDLFDSDYIGIHVSELPFFKNIEIVIIDNIAWFKINKIIKTEEMKRVYNIEVKDDNSYTANRFIVHNCQGFSFSGKRLNFKDPRSALFFEYVRILKEIQEYNPEVKFLLENVVMEKKHQDVISKYLGVEPVKINSNLLSAQQRNRLYWTNIKIDKIKEKNILWKDIQIADPDGEVMYYSDKAFEWIFKDEKRRKRYKLYDEMSPVKMQMIEASHCKGYSNQRCFGILDKNGKTRFIHPIETERCQTIKDNYTAFGEKSDGTIVKISRSQRYKMIGNSFTVDIIAHLIKNYK